MPTSVTWNETAMDIAGTKMHLTRGGSGRPVLILHHDIGTPDRLAFYDTLAQSFDVLIPHHPGWGKSERPQWLRSVRDIAAMHEWLLADLGVSDVSLVGLGFGGWVAAEMASLSPATFRRLVLVGAMGIKPPEGDILDQAIISYLDYPQAGPNSFDWANAAGDTATPVSIATQKTPKLVFILSFLPRRVEARVAPRIRHSKWGSYGEGRYPIRETSI